MEGLVGLLILGFCVWMLIRHPLKSLSFVFKIGFLLIPGLGEFLCGRDGGRGNSYHLHSKVTMPSP